MSYLLNIIIFTIWTGIVSSYKLPTSVIPLNYRLEILTNLGDEDGKFEFHGLVCIKVKCLEPTSNITLHAKNLDIDKETINLKDLTKSDYASKIVDITKDDENDFFSMHFADKLYAEHEYELKMKYKGKLEDILSGFYRSSYIHKPSNEKRYLATTQFEPTDARRAFPCFDEPAMKAKFEISIGHKDKYTAISNMPEIKRENIPDKEGWIWTRFEETVPMSTYLVAFIVSDFGYELAPSEGNNVTFKIWAQKSALNQTKFAQDCGPKFLHYYEKFFDIKYPLPKQDMIAIPDFASGAMENWGLITYREALLLYDPDISSSSSQHSVASVIAHELAHQWFGNLVTMKWWTDLWLNEGFATFMAALAVHDQFPQWNSLEEETASNLLTVFGFDALESSHPVSVPVGHPREIDQIFDTISYKKGSYILRMMSLFLGESTLKKGVSKYLLKHKYNNAEQDDLWESLTEQAHEDGVFPKNLTVKKVMDTWTLQTGFPLITVHRHYGSKDISMRQERFLSNNLKTRSANQCWWVPISYTTAAEKDFSHTRPKYWLPCTDQNETLKVEEIDDSKWIIFNNEAAGLFRVNYDENNWNYIIDALNSDNFEEIPVLNRVQLLDDSAKLAWTGEINYKIFFGIFKYLQKEKRYIPWRAGLRSISDLNQQLKRSADYGVFKEYMKKVITPTYNKLGALKLTRATLAHLDAVKHQSQIASWACKFKVEDCVEDSKNKFREYMNNPDNNEIIPKDLRAVIYCNGIREGGEKEWNFLWQKYLTSNVASEKNQILSALRCTQEIWLLRRFLEWTLQSDSGIRKQDNSMVFSEVASNDVGFFIAQNFLQENIEKIHKFLSPNTRRLGRYLTPLANQMTTKSDYDWFNNLTTTHENYFKEAKQTINRCLEKIQLNIQWQEKHAKDIKTFLEANMD